MFTPPSFPTVESGFSSAPNRRLGFVGLLIEDRTVAAPTINRIFSEHGDLIVARTGIPRVHETAAVITLVVEATTDELGRLTGRLGQVPGVTVRSALLSPPRPRPRKEPT